MSAEISQVNGIAEAMYAREAAWHGLGTVLKDAPNSEGAIKAAHLDWQVGTIPVVGLLNGALGGGQADTDYLENGILPRDGAFTVNGPMAVSIPARMAMASVRLDTGRYFGMVSKSYKPLQNQHAFDFMDSLVADGIVKYEACGALFGGSKIWLLAKMPEGMEVAKGDAIDRYMLLTNCHDGTECINVLPTTVRVVCWNTYQLALNQGRAENRVMKISHVGDLSGKVMQAQKVLGLTTERFDAYLKVARGLAKTPMQKGAGKDKFPKFLDGVLPELGEDAGDIVKGRREEARQAVTHLYREDPKQNLGNIGGTAWAAYSAVSEYADHCGRSRGKDENAKREARFTSVFFGAGRDMKAQAWGNIVSVAGLDLPREILDQAAVPVA